MGYQDDSTNYCLYDSTTNRVMVSRNMTFNEMPVTTLSNTSVNIRLPKEDKQNQDDDEDITTNTGSEVSELGEEVEESEDTLDNHTTGESDTYINRYLYKFTRDNSRQSGTKTNMSNPRNCSTNLPHESPIDNFAIENLYDLTQGTT